VRTMPFFPVGYESVDVGLGVNTHRCALLV
jgi:hypothetical protein